MIDDRLKKVFSEIFKLSTNKINESTSSDSIDRWDSLSHLKLIMAVEKEFNIQFKTDLIPNLSSFKIIKEYLQKVQ